MDWPSMYILKEWWNRQEYKGNRNREKTGNGQSTEEVDGNYHGKYKNMGSR